MCEFANKGMRAYRGKQKFNLLERFVTARKDYRAYRAKLAEYRNLPQQLEIARKKMYAAEDQAEAKLKQSGVVSKIETLEKEIKRLKQATTLAELGVDAAMASQYLAANGVPVNLEKGDEAVLERYLNYKDNLETIVVGRETNDHQRLAHFNAFGASENISDYQQD